MKCWLERVWTWGRHEYSKKQLPRLIGRPSPPGDDDDHHYDNYDHDHDNYHHDNSYHEDDDDQWGGSKKREISFEFCSKFGVFSIP